MKFWWNAQIRGTRQDLWLPLAETLRTGKTGFEIAYGCGSWKYFADHPDARRDFDEAMVNLTTIEGTAV